MVAVEFNNQGLSYTNFVLTDKEAEEFDPDFYSLARKNPMSWEELRAWRGDRTAAGFWADENTAEGRAMLEKHLRNEFSEDAWEEYFYLNCPWGKECGDGTCPLKECTPRDCGRSNWGDPWEDRSFTATRHDEYWADGDCFDGSYTERVMRVWGIPYTTGEIPRWQAEGLQPQADDLQQAAELQQQAAELQQQARDLREQGRSLWDEARQRANYLFDKAVKIDWQARELEEQAEDLIELQKGL